MVNSRSSDREKRSSSLMANLQASGWPCTQHAPKFTVQAYHQGMPTALAAMWMPISISVSELGRATGFGSRQSNTAPDTIIGPAVSPSREIVLYVGISALGVKNADELLVLSERFAVITPAGRTVVRMLVSSRLPITPDRSLGLRSVLFCDEDVGSLVGEDVFPSTPHTSRLIVWPYELPSLVLSPGADWPFWWSTGTPCAVLV